MSKLAAIDLVFLLLENQNSPTHMSSCLIFEPPARQKNTFLPKLVEALRATEVGKPFNRKVKWLEGGVARWEPAQPDMNYHVRHVAIPGPGTMAQLDDTLALLNAPLLDRAYPLWQCFVIEGLEHGRFALYFKLHHAMIDGEGSVKLIGHALSDDPKDKQIRAIWEPLDKPARKKSVRVSQSQLQRIISRVNSLPSGMVDITSGLLDLGAQALKLKPRQAALPFQAPNTPFNVSLSSSARCYANCEIPLDRVKAVARASDCTVNDVALTFIDDALHKYLVEIGRGVDAPLVAGMPLSTRSKGQDSGGNQVSTDLVPMGQPDANITDRLQQIHDSTGRVKARAQKMSVPMRQMYTMLLLGVTAVPELTPGVNLAPSSNLIISNMAGPREQLYMGGAPVVAMHGLPIVPPNPCLNVTFVSVLGQICLAVASTPEAMSDPGRYIELLLESFAELERALIPKRPTPKKTARKKTTPKKPAKTKPAAKKAAGKSVGKRKRARSG
jgi:WS/DGAT/MGAT family acyltransferase